MVGLSSFEVIYGNVNVRSRIIGEKVMTRHMPGSNQSSKPTATIRDIARLTSLSIATVSRALSTPDKVRPETRDRVLSAVRTCGYKPNESAQRLGRLRRAN